MADRNSSNDLVLEQLRELLDERRRDSTDGISLRGLNRQMAEHAAFAEKRHAEHAAADEKRHDEIDDRIREVEQNLARTQGEATGRFNVVPPHTVVIPPMSSNGSRNSRRPSTPPWIVEVTKKPAMIILIALATVLAHALLKLLH